jgi:hypothetical protein
MFCERMRKKIIIVFFMSVFLLLSINTLSAVKISKNNVDIDYTLTVDVEKRPIGWLIKTTFIYNDGANEFIYVEKGGYGDIGVVIYNKQDQEIWTSYLPEDGLEMAIGKGGSYSATNIWAEIDSNGNSVDKGTYYLVGKTGYFENNNYISLETEPYFIEVKSKEKNILINSMIMQLFYNFVSRIT